jgi:putative ABC transport system permease protein
MNSDYVRFAVNNLRRRRLRSWLTMIGIFIGIAAVVALIGLGEGLRTAITAQFGFLGSDILSVQAAGIALAGPPGQGASNPLDERLTKKIAKVNGVEAAVNRHIESVTMDFNDKQAIGVATSVPEGSDRKVFEQMLNLVAKQGRLLRDGDNSKVLLGNAFEEDVIFGKEIRAGDRVLINSKEFEVVGIMEKKGNFIIDQAVFMNEGPFLDLLGDDDTVDIIAVKVKDEGEIADVKERIEKVMRKERDVKIGEEDFSVQSPQSLLSSLDDTLFAVQLFVSIIAIISLLVGGIGILNTMYTSVLERTKEIGVIKSIGATNRAIFIIFFIESGLLGMVGGGIGIIAGWTIAKTFALAGRLALGSDLIQADIGFGLIFGALAFSFIIGTVAGTFPAIQASKLQPVDALRSK